MIALLVFINGHLSMNNANMAVVVAAYPGGSTYLYPRTAVQEKESSKIEYVQGMYRQFRQVNETVLEELDLLLSSGIIKAENNSFISGALSKTLSYTNRIFQNDSEMRSRVLLLSVDGDLSLQYIPIMNCIFAAQKMVSGTRIC